MKLESKSQINWISVMLKDYKKLLEKTGASYIECYENKRKEAQKFLDSLPDIELRLCLGGYIQDRNDTPCCHGDTVKVFTPNGQPNGTGTLCWNATNHQFYIMNRSYGSSLWSFSKDQIEKVK